MPIYHKVLNRPNLNIRELRFVYLGCFIKKACIIVEYLLVITIYNKDERL